MVSSLSQKAHFNIESSISTREGEYQIQKISRNYSKHVDLIQRRNKVREGEKKHRKLNQSRVTNNNEKYRLETS